MGQKYTQLQAEERNSIQRYLNEGFSLRQIGFRLGRPASTISREIRRNVVKSIAYDAIIACASWRERRRRGLVKLKEGSALRGDVFAQIRRGWSPQQISSNIKRMSDPAVSDSIVSDPEASDPAMSDPVLPSVSHETIYRAIYILPFIFFGAGRLARKSRYSRIRLSVQAKSVRGRKSAGQDKRGGLKDMISIHERPADVLTRAFAKSWEGDWEGDFIKGAGNASAIGTLIERKSRFTILAKMKDCSARSALEGFTKALRAFSI